MTTFRFRYESVLRVREAERDGRRASLADAYHQEESLSSDIERIQVAIESCRQRMRQTSPRSYRDVRRLMNVNAYLDRLHSRLGELDRRRRSLEREILARKSALIEADREVRLLERLRDRLRDEFARRREQAEIRRMDEQAGVRYLRNRADCA